MKTAIVLGSSGFVGSYLLRDLLSSSAYEQVTVVVRKDLGLTHPKLTTLIGDYSSLRNLAPELAADEIFLALGTTRKLSPTEAIYREVDHDYPVLAAQLARDRGASSVFLVTAVGANPRSRFFYTRTKGETEQDIIALDFTHTHIFRPSMIVGNRTNKRSLLEAVLLKTWPALDPLLPWQGGRYRGITGEDIAKAMVASAKNQTEKLTIYHWHEMHEVAAKVFA